MVLRLSDLASELGDKARFFMTYLLASELDGNQRCIMILTIPTRVEGLVEDQDLDRGEETIYSDDRWIFSHDHQCFHP